MVGFVARKATTEEGTDPLEIEVPRIIVIRGLIQQGFYHRAPEHGFLRELARVVENHHEPFVYTKVPVDETVEVDRNSTGTTAISFRRI